MKTIESNRILQESNPFTSYQFGIRNEDLPHIFGVLRNQMYSDKILAVIREYSTNAYDAHVVAGIKDSPIFITLPSALFPEFRVRDYGFGMSEDQVKDIYAWYGNSTKRNDNNTVGQLGFGSKSAFAYGDNFVVTSYHDGKKTIYNAVIDPSKKGKISKLHEEPMSKDDLTGIEITVPVKPSDFGLFVQKARNFYAYWDIMPRFAGYDKNTFCARPNVVIESDTWSITGDLGGISTSRIFALMGNVVYPINFEILSEKSGVDTSDVVVVNNITLLKNFLGRNYNNLIIKFKIGDLEISSSRESLQYSDHTLKNIYARINCVIDHIKQSVHEKFHVCKSMWDAKLLYHEYFENYGSKFYGMESQIGNVKWNGVYVNSSHFLGFQRWCNVNGHIDDATYNSFVTKHSDDVQYDSVLTTGRWRNNGWRLRSCTLHESPDIAASHSSVFIVNDIPKVSLLTKCIQQILQNKSSHNVSRVYILQFKKDGLKDEFIKHYNLEGCPMYYVSEVFDEVREKNKRVRKPTSELSSVKTADLGRTFLSRTTWYDTQVDLAQEKGYYVPIEFNEPVHDTRRIGFEDIKSMLTIVNKMSGNHVTPNICLYGFNARILSSRSFKNNKANWINVFDVVCETINKHKNDDYTNYVAYNNYVAYHKGCVPVVWAKEIYSELDVKTSDFAKHLSDISKFNHSLYNQVKELELLIRNSFTEDENYKKRIEEYTKVYELVNDKYPLFSNISFVANWTNRTVVSSREQKLLVDYINLVDKTK
jgi:hypothetical protein